MERVGRYIFPPVSFRADELLSPLHHRASEGEERRIADLPLDPGHHDALNKVLLSGKEDHDARGRHDD